MSEKSKPMSAFHLESNRYAARLIACVALGISSVGLLVFANQVWVWLRQGIWRPKSVIDFLAGEEAWMPGLAKWAQFPTDWIGVHQFVSAIPLSLALIVLGIVLVPFAVAIEENVEQHERDQRAQGKS